MKCIVEITGLGSIIVFVHTFFPIQVLRSHFLQLTTRTARQNFDFTRYAAALENNLEWKITS